MKCSQSCERKVYAKGLCLLHYQRSKSGSDMSAPIQTRRPDGSGCITAHGYIQRGGKKEHRLVMEQHIERPLRKGENIHHLNGDRADNRIENLELWSTKQPPGQRVEDKVKFAIEILELYQKVEDKVKHAIEILSLYKPEALVSADDSEDEVYYIGEVDHQDLQNRR